MHVHELGGEIKVALEVAGIEHVEHYIRRLVYDLPSYVEFLGRIGRKGVSAGQVDDIEVVTLERCRRLLGIHCHSRVVAHVFMCPRREIEQRRLSAVRITHQGNVDSTAFPYCHIMELLVSERRVIGVVALCRTANILRVSLLQCLCLLGRDDLDHLCLLMPQRHLVA